MNRGIASLQLGVKYAAKAVFQLRAPNSFPMDISANTNINHFLDPTLTPCLFSPKRGDQQLHLKENDEKLQQISGMAQYLC